MPPNHVSANALSTAVSSPRLSCFQLFRLLVTDSQPPAALAFSPRYVDVRLRPLLMTPTHSTAWNRPTCTTLAPRLRLCTLLSGRLLQYWPGSCISFCLYYAPSQPPAPLCTRADALSTAGMLVVTFSSRSGAAGSVVATTPVYCVSCKQIMCVHSLFESLFLRLCRHWATPMPFIWHAVQGVCYLFHRVQSAVPSFGFMLTLW